METSDELIATQTKLAYVEDMLKNLNTLVIEQEKRISRLEEESKLMARKYQELWESVTEEIPDRKPPHY
ncbi:MAG: SlyX family protein [Spirochaetaceae bacterium]|jgi:uncharacterized coiled-coil protein SlyX|nr:SlyX family protein [Spirochaetaceae bacterium]